MRYTHRPGVLVKEFGRDEVAHLLEDAGTHRAEERFSLGEGEFDGVEVRRVRREKADQGSDLFDGRIDSANS